MTDIIDVKGKKCKISKGNDQQRHTKPLQLTLFHRDPSLPMCIWSRHSLENHKPFPGKGCRWLPLFVLDSTLFILSLAPKDKLDCLNILGKIEAIMANWFIKDSEGNAIKHVIGKINSKLNSKKSPLPSSCLLHGTQFLVLE